MTRPKGLSADEQTKLWSSIRRWYTALFSYPLDERIRIEQEIESSVDAIAEARAKGARGYLKRCMNELKRCPECGMSDCKDGCAIAAELARGKT